MATMAKILEKGNVRTLVFLKLLLDTFKNKSANERHENRYVSVGGGDNNNTRESIDQKRVILYYYYTWKKMCDGRWLNRKSDNDLEKKVF